MKMIMLWAVFCVGLGLKVKKVDRWVVLILVGFCTANVVYAYMTFD